MPLLDARGGVAYPDGYATVRRIDGKRKSTLAVCSMRKLRLPFLESIAPVLIGDVSL
jgi:hypothetical protein